MTQIASIPPPAADEPRFTALAQLRADPRVRVELNIEFGSEHNFYAGFVENLSAGGVFIATYNILAVGEVIEFELGLPDSEVPVKGTGEVRWTREPREGSDMQPGLGIRFLSLSDESNKIIERFVEQREPMFFDD